MGGSMFSYPGEYVQLPWGVCSTTLESMLSYPGEYFQLPWGVCSTTLGSMFETPVEYVQLRLGVCSTTLGSIFIYQRGMFNYPGEYVVCSATLESMLNYPEDYVRLPWGVFPIALGSIFNYPGIFENVVKSKCFVRGYLKKTRKSIEGERREVFALRFFDFFWAASRETLTFEIIVEWPWSKTCLQSKQCVRRCP